jgi:hypothetical protein
MKIDTLIKNVFELEMEYNRSGMPPVKYVPMDLKKKEQQKDMLLWSQVILFASIMIILFISLISVEDTVLRSFLADQAVGIEKIFPENPSEVFYDFLFGTNSSL